MGVKMEGFDEIERGFERAATELDDQAALEDMVLDAVKPTVRAVAARIGTGSAYRETGKTRADIHAAVDREESRPGVVVIAIGSGPKNAHKVRLQELGTSTQGAHPSLRPGHDETREEVMGRIGAGVKRIVRLGR